MDKAERTLGCRCWRQLLLKGMAATLPKHLLLVQGPTRENSVCLTFDDGPHPQHTPRLLDVLGELGIGATFFVIGRHAQRHPDLVRRVVAEGHTLGHHSYEHCDPRVTTTRQLVKEVRRTRAILADITGVTPSLFRPPYGKVTASKLWALWRARQTIVLWNTDLKDFSCANWGEIMKRLRKRPLKAGDVVLLHDSRQHAASVLPYLSKRAQRRGLTFAPLPNCNR